MSACVKFTPLCASESSPALCYLLEVDNFTFLLDCGWTDEFDLQLLDPLIRVVPQIDCVLLTHPDTYHLGALPFLIGKCGLNATVYATLPVHKMGQMFMYDHFLSRSAVSDFDLFNLDDVDSAFARITALRYLQTCNLTGKGEGIVITPYMAGRYVGGAVWRINVRGEDIVYAVDFNNKKERHLNGTSLETLFNRPAILIQDACNADMPVVDRTRKEKEMIDMLLGTLRSDGSVLVPVDTAGRVLELLLLLDKTWQDMKLFYPMVLLSSVSSSTLEMAKSCLEWMSDTIGKQFEHSRDNPFNCRHLKRCHSLEELGHLPQGPKVVLATGPSLQTGLSRTLFAQWSSDPRNLILFTSQPPPNTVASKLLSWQDQSRSNSRSKTLTLTMSHRVPLTGAELEEWERSRRLAAGQDGGDLYADTDPTPQSAASRVASIARSLDPHNTFANGAPIVRCDGFKPPTDSAGPMFPDEDTYMHEDWTEYGIKLDPGFFVQPGGVGGAGGGPGMEVGVLEGQEKLAIEEEVVEAPTKVVVEEKVVQVNACVRYIDIEGRIDGRSLRAIMTIIAPRELILVKGTRESMGALQEYCKSELQALCTSVHTPGALEPCEVYLPPSFLVGLSDELLSNVRLHKQDAYSLAWVQGKLSQDEAGGPLQLQPLPMAEDTLALDEEDMDALPMSSASGVPTHHGGIFLGDVKLSDLKAALSKAGMSAEFVAGCLVSGPVTISRAVGQAQGELVVEGALCEEYYKIRGILYSLYNIC